MLTGLCAFWAGLAIATLQFPGEFDWRYMTVSNLFSAKHNPSGFVWGAAGVASCGALGLCSLLCAQLQSGPGRGRSRLSQSALLLVGFSFMTLAALIPSRWLLAKGHDWLAVIAFLTLCGGLVRGAVSALLGSYPTATCRRHLLAVAFAGAALWPVAGAAMSQAYLALFRPELPWVTLAWREHHIPLALSFALWEWLTCLTLSACMAVLILNPATGVQRRANSSSPG
jgi:hypothetical protein